MTDIDLLLVQARTRYPGLPIILYGHSLGGIQVLHYGLIRKPNIKGVIATSPGLHTELEKQQGKVLAAKVLGSLIPNTLLASGLDPKGVSRDEKVVQAYMADPLVHDKITVCFFAEVHEAGESIIDRAAELKIPTLVMHGSADRLTSPAGSLDFVDESSGKALLRVWEGFYHELHNEPGWEAVPAFVLNWMKG